MIRGTVWNWQIVADSIPARSKYLYNLQIRVWLLVNVSLYICKRTHDTVEIPGNV